MFLFRSNMVERRCVSDELNSRMKICLCGVVDVKAENVVRTEK